MTVKIIIYNEHRSISFKEGNILKKLIKLSALSLILILIFTINVKGERVNLVNENTEILQMTDAEFANGEFIMSNSSKAYLASFSVPGLPNNYVWEGDIEILEFSEGRGPDGVRFCVGYDTDTGNYLNLIVTKNIGIAAERRGASPMNDLYKLTKEHYAKEIDNGSKFHFEITKNGSHVVLKLDDLVVMDYVFPDEHDYFTEGDDFNLGFHAEKCSFVVTNLAVYSDEYVVTPEPSPTPKKEDTPEPTKAEETSVPATKEPVTTEKVKKEVDPFLIGIIAAVVLVVVVTIIVLIIRKRGNKNA